MAILGQTLLELHKSRSLGDGRINDNGRTSWMFRLKMQIKLATMTLEHREIPEAREYLEGTDVCGVPCLILSELL